ncbi:MAG: transporter substrate-binding domain-containing protein [Bdellovibrio sp.]|nr:transporter substrate-binding domain-containing protein [Bdellovibrio sp.]
MKLFFYILAFSLSTFAKSQNVFVLISTESPPFLSKQMKDQGAAIYALNMILKKMNVSTKISFAPWRRAKIIASEDLKIDGFFPYSAIDMKDNFIYSNFIYEAPWVIVQRKTHPIRWKKIEDLSGMTAGNVTGVEFRPGIEELVDQKKIKIDEVVSDNINLLRLGLERVDFVMMDYFVYQSVMSTDKALLAYKNKFEVNEKPITISRYGLALRKTNQNKKRMDQFNQLASVDLFAKHIEYYLSHFVKPN